MFLTTSASAISRMINNTVSVIHTSDYLGVGTTAAVPLQFILYHEIKIMYIVWRRNQMLTSLSGHLSSEMFTQYNITIVNDTKYLDKTL